MEFFILWLVFWIVPVVVLFNKGQTAWAVTGIVIGWAFPFIWIVAAFATQNRKKVILEYRRHVETLVALENLETSGRQAIPQGPAPIEPTSIDDRLDTLDRLLAAQRITQQEYAVRRRAILDDI